MFSLNIIGLLATMKEEVGEEANSLPTLLPTIKMPLPSRSLSFVVLMVESMTFSITDVVLSSRSNNDVDQGASEVLNLEVVDLDEALRSLNEVFEKFNDLVSEPMVRASSNAPTLPFLDKDVEF